MSRSGSFTSEAACLADLISSSVQTVISEYTGAQTQIPSLDFTTTGPFDNPEAASIKLLNAVKIIEAACVQLTTLVTSPGHTILNKAFGHEEPACFRVIINAKIADILSDYPQGLHVEDIATKSGLEAGKLGRILRFLATKHVFIEVKPDVFANNRLSVKLLSADPLSAFICVLADESMKSFSFLDEALVDPKGHSPLPVDAPFFFSHKTVLFDFYGKSKFHGERFTRGLVGWGDVTGKGMLPRIYPWSNLAKDSVICDVGGANGHKVLGLLRHFPHLKTVIQDEPPVIEEAKEFWSKEAPALVQNDRVQFISFDFFVDPPAEGCDVYFLSHILHDWPDDKCVTILKIVRKAMALRSKLLINEIVVQPVCKGQFDQGSASLG